MAARDVVATGRIATGFGMGRRAGQAAFGLIVAAFVLRTVTDAAHAQRPSEPPRGDAARTTVECLVRAELSGVVTPGMARHLEAGVAAAERRGCALLVVVDTPGGVLEATREIVRAFLGARAPVITYVGGEGARAASAGALVTMAGHVAAMAPSTHLGAAHPVSIGGAEPSEVMDAKIVNDTAAFARAIAERRGRDVELAERMVRESIALTAEEAAARGVIDRVADDERALVAALDGRSVRTAAGEVTLALADAPVEAHAMDLRERIVHRLGDPSLVYLLLMAGTLAILFELSTPGIGAGAIVGGLALFLAFLGLARLPVDVGGVLLIVVGVALVVAEVFVTGYGLLAVGGLACLILGAVLLVDLDDPEFWLAPDFGAAWGLVVPTAVGVGLAVLFLLGRARRVARAPSVTGKEALVGAVGRTTKAVGPGGGEVGVAGERWTAYADEPIEAGTEVRIIDVVGLGLKVRPAHAARS